MRKTTLLLTALLCCVFAVNALVYNVTVPEGTKACYIAGEMNGWSFMEMTKVDDTHYTVDIADATEGLKYKYSSGPDWSYVEKTAENGEVLDRTYSANDVVAKWASVYDPGIVEQRADVTVRIQSASVPTIWWWGGGIAGADQSYTWETKPAMNAVVGAAGWYEWTFENVNVAIGVSYKIVINGQESPELNAKEDVCLDASFIATDCPNTEEPEEPAEPGESITVKVQIPSEGLSSWDATAGVYFYVWTNETDGAFVSAIDEENNWYSYTSETSPINFIVVNGSSWEALEGDVRRQSVSMENVIESACYVMANGTETEGVADWNKVLTATECPGTENPGENPIDPITINVQVVAENLSGWDAANGVYFYVWTNLVNGIFVPATAGEDNWYSYTSEIAPFNFIVVNGADWALAPSQTVDMENITESACYTMEDGTASSLKELSLVDCAVMTEPFVNFSLPPYYALNRSVVFSASAVNVENPVYVYSVKAGDDEYVMCEDNTWTPTIEGAYTVKVEVKEGDEGPVVATAESSTVVMYAPDEITIKVQVPFDDIYGWNAENGVYFFTWGIEAAGTFTQAQAEPNGWYSYTFSTENLFPLNFIVVNGSSWDETASVSLYQTENMTDVMESSCYILSDGATIYSMKVLSLTDCAEATLPFVTLTLPETPVINEPITLSAESYNVNNPVYVYSVKMGDNEYDVLDDNIWLPTEAGDYTVKVEVKEGDGTETVVFAESTVKVYNPADAITINVQVVAENLSGWVADEGVYFYVWTNQEDGMFVPATVGENNWYSFQSLRYPFNFIVVNGSDWSIATRQSVDMENITESICYKLANGDEIVDEPTSWMKVLYVSECPGEGGIGTDISDGIETVQVSVDGRTLSVLLDEDADIALYTINGQLLEHTQTSHLTRELQQGVYIVRINRETKKVVIY